MGGVAVALARLNPVLVVACAEACAGAGSDTGAESSRMEGSAGGGPSCAHLRVSYFDRMNDSILLLFASDNIM